MTRIYMLTLLFVHGGDVREFHHWFETESHCHKVGSEWLRSMMEETYLERYGIKYTCERLEDNPWDPDHPTP